MKLRVKAVFDNGGETLDRYTIVTNINREWPGYGEMYDCLNVSDDDLPTYGIAVSQWDAVNMNAMKRLRSHKRIKFSDLPKGVQKHVKERFVEE